MKYLSVALVVACVLCLVSSCAVANRRAGVANLWRSTPSMGFEVGKTTAEDVLNRLGPPSQMIQMGERTVFYYLLENTRTDALILIIYNQTDTEVDYDRAVFFFDKTGTLEAQSLSAEALPFQDPKRG